MPGMMVALRWDGPPLSRQQLVERASAAADKVSTAFDHVDQLDIRAMPDEEGQYVQLIVNTNASQDECQHMSAMLKREFIQPSGNKIMTDEASPPSVSASEVRVPQNPTSADVEAEEESPSPHDPLMDMMCCIMCADGNIDKRELRTICRILKELKIPWSRTHTENKFKDFIRRVRSKGLACVVEETLTRIREPDCLIRAKLLLDCVDRVVHADGFVDGREMSVRQKLADALDGAWEKLQEFDVEAEVGSWALDDRLRRVDQPAPITRSVPEPEPSRAPPASPEPAHTCAAQPAATVDEGAAREKRAARNSTLRTFRLAMTDLFARAWRHLKRVGKACPPLLAKTKKGSTPPTVTARRSSARAGREAMPTAREIVDRRVGMARDFVFPQSLSKRDQVLEVMDRCFIDPEKMFTYLRRIGTRAEVLHIVNEIERDLEAGRLNRSYIVIGAAARTIRQFSHLI